MAKPYYQAICYTTDHSDGDLIAPACWDPTTSRTKAANQIMQEIDESFSGKIRTATQSGPEYLVIECKHNSVNSCEWDYKDIKNWKRNQKYIQQLQNWLADGEIDTIKVTVPTFLTDGMVQIEESADVFYINSFTLDKPKPNTKPKKNLFKKGDVVWVSGYVSNEDYTCRVDSQGVVEADQKTARSKVLVTIDYIDGDHNACLSVDPKLLSLK